MIKTYIAKKENTEISKITLMHHGKYVNNTDVINLPSGDTIYATIKSEDTVRANAQANEKAAERAHMRETTNALMHANAHAKSANNVSKSNTNVLNTNLANANESYKSVVILNIILNNGKIINVPYIPNKTTGKIIKIYIGRKENTLIRNIKLVYKGHIVNNDDVINRIDSMHAIINRSLH